MAAIKTVTKTVFITEDGREFESEEAALEHEELRHVVSWLERYNNFSDGELDGADLHQLAKELLEDFTPKGTLK